MKIEKFKLFVEAIFEQSKRLLVKDGYVAPVAFVKCGNNINIIELKFEDDATKNKQLRILKEIVKDKNADSIVIVVESWLVIAGDINIGVSPSKHPMRKECILITGECEDGNVSAAQLFHRDRDNKDKIVFGEKMDLDKGLFSKLDFGICKENKKYNKDKQNIDLRDLS